MSNLDNDEKALYNKLKGLLDDFERPASKDYQPAVEVLIDSKYYLVKRYKIK